MYYLFLTNCYRRENKPIVLYYDADVMIKICRGLNTECCSNNVFQTENVPRIVYNILIFLSIRFTFIIFVDGSF